MSGCKGMCGALCMQMLTFHYMLMSQVCVSMRDLEAKAVSCPSWRGQVWDHCLTCLPNYNCLRMVTVLKWLLECWDHEGHQLLKRLDWLLWPIQRCCFSSAASWAMLCGVTQGKNGCIKLSMARKLEFLDICKGHHVCDALDYSLVRYYCISHEETVIESHLLTNVTLSGVKDKAILLGDSSCSRCFYHAPQGLTMHYYVTIYTQLWDSIQWFSPSTFDTCPGTSLG